MNTEESQEHMNIENTELFHIEEFIQQCIK